MTIDRQTVMCLSQAAATGLTFCCAVTQLAVLPEDSVRMAPQWTVVQDTVSFRHWS